MFEVERRQQERCDCCSCPAAAALTAGHSFSRLCIPPAAPEPCHCGDLGRAKPVPQGHSATCWLSCLLTLLGRGNKEQLCHQALEDWSSVQAGAVLGAAQGRTLTVLTGVFLTRGAISCSGPFQLCCLYSLLKVLFL